MPHPNLRKLEGRDPACTFPVRTFAQVCPIHADCTMISHWEQRDPAAGFVRAWHSHAHTTTHIACRIGDATPVVEDHTVAKPKLVEWRPMCADCHEAFRHGEHAHHTGGLKHIGDGRYALSTLHPRFVELSTHPDVEVHNGPDWRSCARCAGHGAACDGCAAQLDAQGQP